MTRDQIEALRVRVKSARDALYDEQNVLEAIEELDALDEVLLEHSLDALAAEVRGVST